MEGHLHRATQGKVFLHSKPLLEGERGFGHPDLGSDCTLSCFAEMGHGPSPASTFSPPKFSSCIAPVCPTAVGRFPLSLGLDRRHTKPPTHGGAICCLAHLRCYPITEATKRFFLVRSSQSQQRWLLYQGVFSSRWSPRGGQKQPHKLKPCLRQCQQPAATPRGLGMVQSPSK